MLYVNDVLLCEDKRIWSDIMENLIKTFETTTCKLEYLVALEIEHNHDGLIFIHSQTYRKKVLKKFYLEDCNPVILPADPNVILSSFLSENDIFVSIYGSYF